MSLYNPGKWESFKSFGLSLANVIGNNPDTLPFTMVEVAAGALMAIPGGQAAGAGSLAALSLGGGGAAMKVYRTGKALRTLRNVASTAWSMGAGGVPAWGRSWGLVRAALWNGAVAAGANTTLNYISQSYNIAAANGLHYMNPDMAATINNEELLDSALYGFMFGAGLSAGFGLLSTGLGKLGGSKNTPLDVSYRNFQRVFGKNTVRAGGPSPISRTIVKAEAEGRSPTIEEAHGAVVARAASVDAASDVAARSADTTPDNPLMKRFEGEELGNYTQRMADSQAMTNAGMVLDAMSGGRRFKDLSPEEQHQVALESLQPINDIAEKELASKNITKERKSELEDIRKEAEKVVRDTGKQLSKATKEKIATNVKEGKAYTRMGIQTPNALDNASTAKAKARNNAEEIFDRASGKEPNKNTDTSPEGVAAEEKAEMEVSALAEEQALTPERVKENPAHRRTLVASITKKLLGGDPVVTMKRLAIARSKARKLTKVQRNRQLRVLNNRASFLNEAVGNRETINLFYNRIQTLVDNNFLSEEAATLVMAMTVNLNFDRKPAQTKITIGTDIGYSITNDEIRLGNMVLEAPNSEIRQAIIVIHEIGHAYEMYATGASLMKFRKLFQDPKALEAAARNLLESSPFNINYTVGNTQELFAVTFARMLLDELSYTVMLNAAGKNKGLLSYLLKEAVADIGASLIHVANTLKESDNINYVNLYGIVQEVMQQLEEGGKPTLRRVDAVNKITNGIQRIKQSYEEYASKTPAFKRLTFAQWVSKKERTTQLANKINRALVEDITDEVTGMPLGALAEAGERPANLREQIVLDYGVTPQEAALLVRMAMDNSSMVDTFINTRAEGLRLTADSTPAQVRAFAESMAMNQQITRRYFLNIFENYVMALQLNGMTAPKNPMTEGNRGPVTNQLEELDAFVNSQPISALEIQQPYLDPTLGILSNDVNLAVHYLAAQEGIDITTRPEVDILGAPAQIERNTDSQTIAVEYAKVNSKWTPLLNVLNEIIGPIGVTTVVYKDWIRAFYRVSRKEIHIPATHLALTEANANSSTAGIYVHELAHAATSTKLYQYIQKEVSQFVIRPGFTFFENLSGKNYLNAIAEWANNPLVDPAVRELFDTFLEAAKSSPQNWKLMQRSANVKGSGDAMVRRGGEYGFGNIDEFIAQAFNEPEVQKLLMSLPSKKRGQSIYTRLVNALRKFLGISDTQESLFDDLMRLTEEIATIPLSEMEGTRRAVAAIEARQIPKGATKQKFGFTLKPEIVNIGRQTESIQFGNTNYKYYFQLNVPDLEVDLKPDPNTKTIKTGFRKDNPITEANTSDGFVLILDQNNFRQSQWILSDRSWDSGPFKDNKGSTTYYTVLNRLSPERVQNINDILIEAGFTEQIPKDKVFNFVLQKWKEQVKLELEERLKNREDDGYTIQRVIPTKDLLGAPKERPAVPTTREEAANKLGILSKEVQSKPKMSKKALVARITAEMNVGPGLAKLLEEQPNKTEVLNTIAKGLQDGTIEVDTTGMRVSIAVLEAELTPAELRTVEQTPPTETVTDVTMASAVLQAAVSDNATKPDTQARTAAIVATSGEKLQAIPNEPRTKPESEVRQTVKDQAKKNQEAADIADAELTTADSNTNRSVAPSEPQGAIGSTTAVITDDVTPVTPHVPVGVAETAASNNNSTNKFTATAQTKPMQSINVSNANFNNPRFGIVNDIYYASLAEIEGILASIPTERMLLNPENLRRRIRLLYAKGREQKAIDMFVRTMELLEIEGVIVRDAKKPQVIVRKFMFNKNKWSYGGIAMTERTKPSTKAEKAKAPDGTDVPVSKVEKDSPDPVEKPVPEPKVSPADKLAILLEESREGLRDSGMDVPDFGLLLKKFWRVMKDQAKKKSQYITDEFKHLAYTLSDINATIMEMNRNQLRDSHIARKFFAEVDRLVAIEQANLQNTANYQMRRMKDIYAEAAAKVSTSTIRFIPPLHPSQIEFKKVKIKGKTFIKIIYKVDKETLKLIRTIQEDTSRLAPKPSPTTVTTPSMGRPVEAPLPNAPNSAKDGGTSEKPMDEPTKPAEEEEITERTLVKNVIKFLKENKAINLRASSWLHFIFGGSERNNRNWWRTAMSKAKDFTQLWSSQGLTQRSVVSTLRTLAHLFDPSHSKLSDLLLPDQARTLISFAQAHQEANSSILGIVDAYNILRRAANTIKLNAEQQNILLKYYALSFMEGKAFAKDALKDVLGVDPSDELMAALDKLKTQETRLNQLMLDLKEETGWSPIKDKDGNLVTGDKYFSITFDVDKFRRLEEAGQAEELIEALIKARTQSKLKSERLDTNTLIVMGILNIDNVDNIFYGERKFVVTTNPNLSKETLDKLRDPDRGYKIHNKEHLSEDIQKDIKTARKENARKFFVRETETHIEIIPMPETIADLAEVDLVKYRKAIEGDVSVYADGWRKFLGGKTLVQREIKELINYKLFRGEYALRNTSRFKRGLRPVLNAKDDNFLRVANVTQQELIDNPILMDLIDLRRDQVAYNLMRYNLFDLYAQRSIDKLAQHKGLRPWRALELIEEEIQKEIQSSSELTQAQKNELSNQVTKGMTRLLYQYSDWNGTLPQIRSPGDSIPKAVRALVSWTGVGWGVSNLSEPVQEMIRKLPSKYGLGIPVDLIRGFIRFMKVWDRSSPAEKAKLKDTVYALEDAQNNFSKLEDAAQRGELNATDTSYSSVYRQTRREMASQSKLSDKTISVMQGIGRASILLGGSREVTNHARSIGRVRLQRQAYAIIKKTNIDRFIELLKDPKNRQLQEDLLKASETSAQSERQLWAKYKALARQAGIDPHDALFISKFGLTDADNLKAIRWVMNELNIEEGQLDFLDLRDMFYTLKGMENPPIDPVIMDRARSAYEFGLVSMINQRSAPFMTGLNKALGPFMLTEYGKLMNTLTSWLRGWEDAFGANLVNMGSARAITSILVVGAVTNAIAALLREWINGRDMEDILEEIEDNPIAYTAYVASEMPFAGVATPIVSSSVRKAVALSGGGTYGYSQGILNSLSNSISGGPALNAAMGIVRNTSNGVDLFAEGVTENDTAKMVAGALKASQISSLVNKGPTGFSVRAAEEFGLWNKVGGLQTVLDHLQRDPKPYAKKKRGAMADYLKRTGYVAPKRNLALERATWEARQAERPAITPIKPTPKVETGQEGVSSILGALLEGYRGTP